jgi:hypothetical protein
MLMPHGGTGVVRTLCEELTLAGIHHDEAPDPLSHYPEARSEVDARALHALSASPSPLAIELLLAQHERWLAPAARSDPHIDAQLRRLLHPPLVVALGAPNIGKSSLLNALAKQSLAITCDESGTTRDHVGALLELHGLVVHYVDTPGMDVLTTEPHATDSIMAEARLLALDVASRADLLLLCCDATRAPLARTEPLLSMPALTVALRSDRGTPAQTPEILTCARTGDGLDKLARAIRASLVPDTALSHNGPWQFWSSCPPARSIAPRS